MKWNKFYLFGISILFLNSCEKQKEILKGDREAVLKTQVMAKEETIEIPVVLPTPVSLTEWLQPYSPMVQGIAPLYIKDHLLMEAEQSIDMGIYPSLLEQPVSNGKYLYILDGQGTVCAYSLSENDMFSVKWSFSIVPEKKNSFSMGGGISCDKNYVYVSSPYGEIICLNNETGDIRWRRNLRSPLRSAPVLKGQYGVVLTINNEVEAFSLSNGSHLWSHKGMVEAASLLKQNHLVISENVVVVIYSSGEVHALRLENGHSLWTHSLISGRRFDARSLLMPVSAQCIISKGYIFICSQNDKIACIHLRSGKKVWEKNILNIKDIILAGDYIYGVRGHQELICLHASTGKQIWIKPLDPVDESVQWGQPLLLNNNIFISNTEGKGRFYSAINGHWVKDIELSGPTLTSPVVFGGKMYLLSNDGNLSVWK